MEKLLEYLNSERGRRVTLAAALEINPSAISQWKDVPAERVLDVENITGISRHDLRPDVFGAPKPSKSVKEAAE